MQPSSTTSSRLAGAAGIAVGFALTVVYFNIPGLRRAWGPYGSMLFLALVLGVFFWGLRTVLLPPRDAADGDGDGEKLTSLNGNWVRFPGEGKSYLIIMASLFVASFLGRSNLLLLVFCMMTGPFLLNGAVIFAALRRCELIRRLPVRVMAGERFRVEMEVINGNRIIPIWFLKVLDFLEHRRERLKAPMLFTRIPGQESRTAYYQIQLAHRGRYQFTKAGVSSRFPLGLIERGRDFQLHSEILVYPRVGRLTTRWTHEHELAADFVAVAQPRSGVHADEFHRLREYRAGDNPRAIHWRSSARRNELITREFQQNREQNLAICVDLRRSKESGSDQADRVELALSFLATVCLDHVGRHRESGIELSICGQDTRQWSGRASREGLGDLLDLLATVEPGSAENLREECELLISRSARDARLLLLTTRLGTSESPGEELPEITDPYGRLQVLSAERDALAPYFSLDP